MRITRFVRNTVVLAGVAALAGVGVVPASADTKTATLDVSATVSRTCSVSASALSFGAYDVTSENAVDGTGQLTVACTKGIAPTIALGSGNNPSSTSGRTRQMANGSNLLGYELYADSSRSTVWNGSTLLEPGAAESRTARQFTVYGRIPAGQDASVGDYTDAVVATVNF